MTPTATKENGLMNRRTLLTSVVACIVALASGALKPRATEARTGDPSPTKVEDRTVSLDYQMGEIRTVLADIARQVQVELRADDAIGGKISLKTENSRISSIMDAICLNFYCNWKIEAGNPPALVVTSRPAPK
jgi:type II secretory pathway component HofQ